MEGSMMQYPPGDPRLVDKIVCQLKSQGIFDRFRKECISDVDTKPAYQNLHQRVEGTVSAFLANQEWRPELNKNQLRDSLRKHIHEAKILDLGVERIVDQVVNPKILPVFLPQIEDVVYNFLGIEKPKKKYSQTVASLQSAKNFKPLKMETLEDLLPKDLDPISPGSVGVNSDDENGIDDMKNEIKEEHDNENEKMCDEEESSPPFEPIEKLHVHDDNSLDSHLSGISGLTSHDSQMSNLSFGREPSRPHMEQNFPLKNTTLDLSNQDSQLSKVSSGSRLSIVFSEDLDKSDQRTSPCTSDMDVQNDDSQNSKMDIPMEFEPDSEAELELKPEPEPEFEPEPDPDLDPETETSCVPVTVPVPPPLPISSLPIEINEESNCAYDSAILKVCPHEVPIKCPSPVDTISERLSSENQDQTSEIPCEKKDTNEEGLEGTTELDFDDREKQRERKEDRKQSSISTDSRDSKRSESTSNSSDSERRKSDKDRSHRSKDYPKQEEKRRDSKDKLRLEDKSEKEKEDCLEQIEGQVHDEKLDYNLIQDKDMLQKPKSETNGELTKSGELTNENDTGDLKEKQKEKLKNDIKIEKDLSKEKVKNEEKELRDKTKSDEKEKNKSDKGQSREASKDRSEKDIKRSHHEERAKEYGKEKSKVEDKSEKIEREVIKEKSRHDEKSRDMSKDKMKISDKESSKERQKIEEKGDKENHKEKSKTEDKSKRDLSKDKTKHERSEKDGSRDSSKHRDQERGRSRSDGREKRDDKNKRSENGDDEKRSKSQSDQKRDRERSSKESSRHSDKGKFDRGKCDDKSKEGKFENKESSSKHDSRSNDKSTNKDSKSKSRTESKEREEKRESKKDERNKEKSKEEKGDRERGKDDRRHKDKTKEERSDKDKYKQDKEKSKDEKDKSKDRDKDRSSRSSHSSKDSDTSKKTDRDSSSKSRSSSEKNKDSRKKEKARPAHDDHSVHRDRRSDDRRSTDRDSNGAAHGQSANTHSSKRPERGGVDDGSSTSSKSEGGGTGGGGNGRGGSEATDTCATGMEINEAREISLDEGVTQSLPFKKRPVVSSPEPSDVTPTDEYDCVNNAAGKLVLKLKKPKIAANIFEVRKIMHLRKSMAKIERKKQRAEKLVNVKMESATDENSYDEQDLMFFTEEEARPESAFLQFIKGLEKSETLSELAASDEEDMPEHSKAKRYEHVPSEALSSSTSTEETVRTPERTGVVSTTRPEVIHSSLAKQESTRGKASQAIPERKEKRRRDREVRRETPQRESRFRTTVASHDVNRTSPEAETVSNPVMGNYLPSHISAVLGIDSGLNVNITKAPSPIPEDVSPVESEIGNHATSAPNPSRSFTSSPALRGRPPKRRAAPSPVFAADSSTTTPKRLRGDVQPVATNAISGIVPLEEPNKSADTRAVYSASVATNRQATLGMRKLHTTRSPSIINYGGYISKEIVEVKVLDADGDVDEYSTDVKENNNVDKSSSDDEKGCGEDMSLSKELISTALRDLMMESGLNLAESSAPPASTAREESEVVEEGSATSGPGRRVGLKAVRGRRLGLTRPTRRTASVDTLPQTGSEFVLTPSSNNVAEPKEASATAGTAAEGSPRESATVGAGAFAGPSSRAGLAGGELPAPGRHKHR